MVVRVAGTKETREVTFTGHSIECRVNAEDPETFTPSPGVIHAFSVPGGPGVRVDSHVYDGYAIPPFYDSLVAKVIVWAPATAGTAAVNDTTTRVRLTLKCSIAPKG